MENASTLYGAIKREYSARAEASKNLTGHPDAEKFYDLRTKVLSDLIRDYKAVGGKRDVEKYR